MSDDKKQPEVQEEPIKTDAELSDDELDNVAGGCVNQVAKNVI